MFLFIISGAMIVAGVLFSLRSASSVTTEIENTFDPLNDPCYQGIN